MKIESRGATLQPLLTAGENCRVGFVVDGNCRDQPRAGTYDLPKAGLVSSPWDGVVVLRGTDNGTLVYYTGLPGSAFVNADLLHAWTGTPAEAEPIAKRLNGYRYLHGYVFTAVPFIGGAM